MYSITTLNEQILVFVSAVCRFKSHCSYFTITDHKIPAATAEPITPATLGAIACINKKLCGSSSCPTICTTRAESGTADTPAAPTSGLILSLRNKFINLANLNTGLMNGCLALNIAVAHRG